MPELLLFSQLLLGLCQGLDRWHAFLPPELIKSGHKLGGALVRHSPERADDSGEARSDECRGKRYNLIWKLGARNACLAGRECGHPRPVQVQLKQIFHGQDLVVGHQEPAIFGITPVGSPVAGEVGHLCAWQILEHEKATRSAALQALPGAQVAHFSCHGGANWSDPEQSGLLMANNEILTVKDLFELHLEGTRLATLSACETGVPGTKLPDEAVSLPSAFIRAGFAGAIGSLWTVSDESTAQLMTSFYQLWRVKDMSPVQALAEAQKRLRESEKFQHPFYWAAFYLTGV
jgi:hypothetical protein